MVVFVTYWWAKSKHDTNPNTTYDHLEKKDTNRALTYFDTTEQLRRDVESKGLVFYAKRKRFGDYQSNINYKPRFIKECLRKFKQPVVYLDSDLRVYKRPELFLSPSTTRNVDFMALNWNGDRLPFETAGPVFYFGNTPNATTLLDAWIRLTDMETHRGKADDRLLAMAFATENASSWCNYRWFPPTYLYFPAYFSNIPKHKVVIGHPYDSTSETDAHRRFGTAKNRVPSNYTRVISSSSSSKTPQTSCRCSS
jgi:hypothetical protein